MHEHEHLMRRFYEETNRNREFGPAILYSELLNWVDKLPRTYCKKTYLTTAMTSGGYIRTGALCSPSEAFGKNCTLAEAMVSQLLRDRELSSEDMLIFPPDVGKLPKWGQIEYNMFWYFVISGVTGDNARRIENYASPHKGMENRESPIEERRGYYAKFLDQLIEATEATYPVDGIVQLLDPSSLGSYFEQNIAMKWGIPVKRTAVNNAKTLENGCQDLYSLRNEGIEIPFVNMPDLNSVLVILSLAELGLVE